MTRFKDAVDFTWTFLKGKPTTVAASGLADAIAEGDTRLTNARTPISGAGGVLGGTYPNPGFAVDMATQGELDAEVTARANADALLAPLASPAFTGTPTAPTAAAVTNTTQLATTAFVQAVVAAVINSAPGALDTLKELADAIGDDANFAATVTTALAGKQPLDSELTALAALASAANKLPYFTGSGAASLADLTAAGRALIDDADAAAQRATLGVGTVVLPSQQNLLGWVSDPIIVNSAAAPAAGVLYLTKVFVPQDITITNIIEVVNTAGATLTSGQNLCGIFDSAGNRLGVTADQSTNWTSTGAKVMPLTTPVAVTGGANTFIWVATLVNGTTPPSFWRATSNAALANVGLTSAYRTGNIGTGQTSIPATITVASITASTNPPWVAIS